MPLRSIVPRPGGRHGLATLFAVLTGVTIAGYIIADGLGVRAAGPTFEHRLSYIAWLCVVEGPWLLVLAVALRPRTVWTHLRKTWWRGVIGGADRQYRLRHRDLRPGAGADGACRGPARDLGAVRRPDGHAAAGRAVSALRRVAAAAVIVIGLVLMNGPQLI